MKSKSIGVALIQFMIMMTSLNHLGAQEAKKVPTREKQDPPAAQSSRRPTPVDNGSNRRFQPAPYEPQSVELYETIVAMDSLYFETYNNCDLEKMRSLMADSIEFYHDRGGLATSVVDFVESIKNNICGKVIRKAVPNSIEVYPINNYGAVEIGYHRFFNKKEPENGFSKPDKYIVIWQNKNGHWKITRVVSLH